MEEDQREDFLLPHVVGPRTVGRGGSRSHRPGSGFRPHRLLPVRSGWWAGGTFTL